MLMSVPEPILIVRATRPPAMIRWEISPLRPIRFPSRPWRHSGSAAAPCKLRRTLRALCREGPAFRHLGHLPIAFREAQKRPPGLSEHHFLGNEQKLFGAQPVVRAPCSRSEDCGYGLMVFATTSRRACAGRFRLTAIFPRAIQCNQGSRTQVRRPERTGRVPFVGGRMRQRPKAVAEPRSRRTS